MTETISAEAGPEIMRATQRGRRLALAQAVVGVVLLLPFLLVVLPLLNSGFNPMPAASQITLIKAILVGLAAMGVAAAAVLIRSGRKILRSGQCPAPDTWVWRDTKVIRGTPAIRLAWIYIVVAALCGILCVGLTAYILVVLNRLPPQFNLPKDIKIIEHRSFLGKQ